MIIYNELAVVHAVYMYIIHKDTLLLQVVFFFILLSRVENRLFRIINI